MYKVVDYDLAHYASGLRLSGDTNLNWDSSNAQDVLIVEYKFGGRLDIEELCEALNKLPPGSYLNEYTDIGNSMYVKYVSAIEKVRQNGCMLHTAGSSYAVICCSREADGTVNLYRYIEANFSSISCDAPLKMEVAIYQQFVPVNPNTGGLFTGMLRKNETETYYAIQFYPHFTSGYSDGDIFYEINISESEVIKVPITKNMIFSDTRTIYVKMAYPVIKGRGNKINLSVRGGM